MVNVTVSQILDEVDNEYFTLYAEWLDSQIKIMLLKPDSVALSGEMNAQDVNYFSEELSKSCDDYLQKAKEAFCGKDDDIKFSIRDETLEWKQQNIWILGKITLSQVTDIQTISKTFGRLANCHRTVQDKLFALEKENESLREIATKLTVQIEGMKRVKDTIENELYKKFLFILNEKKRKIRELESTIKEGSCAKDSVFDACTDQSEESEEEKDKSNIIETKSKIIGKRKSVHKSNSEDVCKTRKTERSTIKGTERDGRQSPRPSSSKNPLVGKEDIPKNNSVLDTDRAYDKEQKIDYGAKKAHPLINFLEEESEEELFSQ